MKLAKEAFKDRTDRVPDWLKNPEIPVMQLPAFHIPGFRAQRAREAGLANKWLIYTWGGLGDAVCATPTIQFILNRMPEIDLFVKTEWPELFRDARLKAVFGPDDKPNDKEFYVSQTIHPPDYLQWQFFNHMVTHSVDFISQSILRMQLPVGERAIVLPDYPLPPGLDTAVDWERAIIVHAGRHWPSKTFPQDWWQDVIDRLAQRFQVVLIGRDLGHDQGYVPLTPTANAVDLRDALTLPGLIAVLKRCKRVLTNDSAPLHIAAAGNARIYFLASVKHEDYLYHWRKGVFGAGMVHLNRDNMFNEGGFNFCTGEDLILEGCTRERMLEMIGHPLNTVQSIVQLEGALS